MLMATINSSVMLIALPDICRGIGVNPLQLGNTGLLLWMLMGYLVVTAVLVVSFGRLGDLFGRVRMYNLGFAMFAVFSILLSITWMHGTAAAWWLICMRVMQGVGGAMLMANSSAILTDAFPPGERGLALGLNQVAGIAGSFIGLVLGGLLGPVEWHLAEQSAEDKADERSGDAGDLVETEGKTSLARRKRVSEDRAGVGHEHGAADALHDPHADQPPGGGGAVHPRDGQQDGEHREHRETKVIHPNPAKEITESAEADHEHCSDHQVAHQHPEQQARISRLERVDADPAEDVGEGDQHHGAVDGGHQHAQRGVRQGDPLVVQAGLFWLPGG